MVKYIFLIIGLILSFLTGCTEEKKTEKIEVVVSILPLAEFAEKVGGDRVAVSVMVPPGASPHSYEPTPNQLTKVNKAKIYVKLGTPIEFELVWLDKILSTNKNILVVDASKGTELINHDPHIWLSPQNVKLMITNICNGLIKVDSTHKKYYTENKEKYLKKLDSLHYYIENVLKEKKNRKFLVYHPSWSYFARDYNLEQISIEIEGKEPSAKEIQHLIALAREHNIKVVFASPQFNTKSAEVIAKEIGGQVVLIDPLSKDYIKNMKQIAQALSESME